MSARVVVVGAGLAAVRFVLSLRRFGFDGPVTVVGDEPELPYDRPPLSKEVLSGEKTIEDVWLASADDLHESGITTKLGVRAIGVDRKSKTLMTTDGDVPYDDLVVASGLRPRHLPMTEGLSKVHVLRSAADCQRLRGDVQSARHAVVIGAGFIGCEIAATLCGSGLDVDLVEPNALPLEAALDPWIGARVAQLHSAHGVKLRLNTLVSDVHTYNGKPRVMLSDGASMDPDVVIVGVGSVPCTDWLEGSGLDITDGVLCDSQGRTEDPAIWAIGDVARRRSDDGSARRVEHWTSAGEQGTALARLFAGKGPSPVPSVDYVWSDQYGVKLQVLGHVRAASDAHVLVDEPERFLIMYEAAGRLSAAAGLGMAGRVMKLRGAVASHAPICDVM